MSTSQQKVDKIVNYNAANNSYLYALNLAKTLGLTGFMDKIPFPCDTNVVNIQLPQEQTQTAPQEAKSTGKGILKAAAIGAALFGTGGLGALAIPAVLSMLDKPVQNTNSSLPEVKVPPAIDKTDPNFSFEVH